MIVSLVTVAVAWLAALVCVPSAVARGRWSLAAGAGSAAVMMTLQAPPVYRVVDPLLGGVNVTNLLFRLAALVCIAGFGTMVATAWAPRPVAATRAVLVLSVACGVAQAALFAVNRWPVSDPHLARYATEPGYLPYAAILWLAMLLLAACTAAAGLRETRGRPWTAARAGVTTIAAGSAVGVAWCVTAFAGGLRAVLTGTRPSEADVTGQVLLLLTALGVLGGLAMTAVPAAVDAMRVAWLQWESRQLWRRAVQAAPEVMLPRPTRLQGPSEREAYRRWVEVEDAIRLRRVALTGREAGLVARMEAAFGSRPQAADALAGEDTGGSPSAWQLRRTA